MMSVLAFLFVLKVNGVQEIQRLSFIFQELLHQVLPIHTYLQLEGEVKTKRFCLVPTMYFHGVSLCLNVPFLLGLPVDNFFLPGIIKSMKLSFLFVWTIICGASVRIKQVSKFALGLISPGSAVDSQSVSQG